tara:strand:+ start:625 stop:933 length:309 start_codon:yes stop_codon:yes gene_type:complete
MNDLIAQTTGLDAKWVVTGLAGAFVVFAGWVGKFAKQIWSEFKDMHINHTKTLESAISKQGESTSDLKAMTTKVLTETREIRKIQEDTKYSISAINKKLDTL